MIKPSMVIFKKGDMIWSKEWNRFFEVKEVKIRYKKAFYYIDHGFVKGFCNADIDFEKTLKNMGKDLILIDKKRGCVDFVNLGDVTLEDEEIIYRLPDKPKEPKEPKLRYLKEEEFKKESDKNDNKESILQKTAENDNKYLELACELHMEAIKEAGEIIAEQKKTIKEMCRDKVFYETIIKTLDAKIERIETELEREKKIVNKIIENS